MMNKKSLHIVSALTFVLGAAIHPISGAELPGGKKTSPGAGLSSAAQVKAAGVLNINNLVSWYRANGLGQYGPANLQGDGSSFPRGTSHPFFADGIVWGAKAFLDAAHTQPAPFQLIRVGGNTYNSGNREGWIQGSGANA